MRFVAMLTIVVALSACDKPSRDAAEKDEKAAAEELAETIDAVATAEPEESERDKLRRAVKTALDFMQAAKAKGFGAQMKNIVDHTEETDPNKLLGRPGQYLKKLNWTVDGEDATLEVFPTLDAAKKRAEYVKKLGQGSSLLLQYVYVNDERMAVLRLDKGVTPSKAKEWQKLLDSI